jgi:4-aminobutyrate aminotransferase
LAVIEGERLVAKAADLGARALTDLHQRMGTIPGVCSVRGLGLYFGIELADAAVADAAMYRCLERGLSFKIGGGNVMTLCPPLTIGESDLAQAFDIVTDVLRVVA